MTIRLAHPIYKVTFWSDKSPPAPDVDGWERALVTDVWPQIEKGIGSLSRRGSFGYEADHLPWGNESQGGPITDGKPLFATVHQFLNISQIGFTGGAKFNLRVPPGDYMVTVGVGNLDPTITDIRVNRVLYYSLVQDGIIAGGTYPEVAKIISAPNGFVSIEIARFDLTADFASVMAFVKVEPVVYDNDDDYPVVTSALVDPASAADQELVANLTQRDTSLRERNISLTFEPVTVATSTYQVVQTWSLYVPRYANQLVVGVKSSVSFNGSGSGGRVWFAIDRNANEALNDNASGNYSVALSNGVWIRSTLDEENTTPTLREHRIDVRGFTGQEVTLSMVARVDTRDDPGLQMLIGNLTTHTSRFDFVPEFHPNDTQFRGTASFAAVPTIV